MAVRSLIVDAVQSKGNIDDIINFINIDRDRIEYDDLDDGDFQITFRNQTMIVWNGDYLVYLSNGDYDVVNGRTFDACCEIY